MSSISKVFALIALAGFWAQSDLQAQTQTFTSNEGAVLALPLTYSIQWPGGDLADRFGSNFNTSIGLQLFLKSNWMMEVEGQLLFGQSVIPDVLAPLRSPEGYIFADDGRPAKIALRERRFWLGASIG